MKNNITETIINSTFFLTKLTSFFMYYVKENININSNEEIKYTIICYRVVYIQSLGIVKVFEKFYRESLLVSYI